MATLLTTVDEWDPFVPGGGEDASAHGPTLSLIKAIAPTRLVLISTSASASQAIALETVLRDLHPDLEVEWISLPLTQPHLADRLRAELKRNSAFGPICICANTGPEAMQTAWPFVVEDAPDARWIATRSILPAGAIEITDSKPRPTARALEPALAYEAISVRPTAPDLATACQQIGLRGEDPAFRAVLEMAERLAPHPVPLLIQGETGSGKGMLAALIHEMSGRGCAPFVAVNCAALPETLVESILFGHRKGAFTGAGTDQPGKFVLADGGTLFLDEIGELPLALQAKLLRVLENGVVEPIGAIRGTAVNVRVLAATHRDLKSAIAEKTFREDLYFRLGYAQLQLPPLRARPADIKLLALYHLTQLNRSLPVPRRMDISALRRLEDHSWPGNIRELANVIGRSAIFSDNATLTGADIQIDPLPAQPSSRSTLPDLGAGFSLESYLADTRHALIQRALEQSANNKSKAARLLGISPQAIHKYLRSRGE